MGMWTVVMKGILLLLLLLLLLLIVIVSYKALSHLWGVYLANPHPCTPAPLHPTLDHTSMSLTPRGLGCTEGVGGGDMGVWTIVMKGIGSTITSTNTNTNSNSIL